MNTTWIILLIVSLACNVALVIFSISFKKDIKNLKGRITDMRQSGLRRRIHFGHGKKSLGEISAELNDLMDAFQQIIETKQQPEHSRKQLITSISRDIRAPLAALTGELEALREKSVAGDARGEYLEIVYRKARLMHRTIEEFFELAKLEAEDETLKLQPLDVGENIRALLASFYQEFVSAGISPEVHLPEAPVMALGNRTALERVLSNLLFNALKRGSGGGGIAVGLRAENGLATVSIADQGEPIPAEDLPQVFDRFYTADKARSAMERGSGLGLAIAKRLVEKQNGAITVSSAPDAETTFTFTLQLADD